MKQDTTKIRITAKANIETFSIRKISSLINKTNKEIQAINREIERQTKKLETKNNYLSQLKQALINNKSMPLDSQEIRAKIAKLNPEQQKQNEASNFGNNEYNVSDLEQDLQKDMGEEQRQQQILDEEIPLFDNAESNDNSNEFNEYYQIGGTNKKKKRNKKKNLKLQNQKVKIKKEKKEKK